MLSAVRVIRRRRILLTGSQLRSLTTETVQSADSSNPPPPPAKHPTAKQRTRLSPAPRSTVSHHRQVLPSLPPTFGRNQLLPVSSSKRALLESIVADFDAPIRYAFAYGSGVFEQDGYKPDANDGPMLDFMFAVTHPAHFHSINMAQHPSHYAMHARVLGSSFVSKVQEVSPGVWFNAFVESKGTVRDVIIYIPSLLITDVP